MTTSVPIERIASKIYLIRNVKIMLDRDLAELYGVETKRLKEQVRRNIERFPEDFMFGLTKEELKNLRSQFATSSWGGMRRAKPYAFTEQGVAMFASLNEQLVYLGLTSVLRSFREAMTQPMMLREDQSTYGGEES